MVVFFNPTLRVNEKKNSQVSLRTAQGAAFEIAKESYFFFFFLVFYFSIPVLLRFGNSESPFSRELNFPIKKKRNV